MTLHMPTHPRGFTGHPHVGNWMLPIVAIALGIVLWAAAVVIQPHFSVTVGPASQQQLFNDYRAGERELWAGSYSAQQLLNDYRAGERELWAGSYSAQQLLNDYRAGERASWNLP
jgi:hypothetical protein